MLALFRFLKHHDTMNAFISQLVKSLNLAVTMTAYGCSSVGAPAPLELDMFQGVAYKYFSLNNNVTDIV